MASGTVSKESERAPVVRVRSEPAFVLSSQPWRETSVIAELLTRHHGRVTVVARGAKRISSRFRGIIMPFVPLVVSFSGAGEIKNLTDARWMGPMTPNEHEGLVSAFYVNELLVRLLPREDEVKSLFASYVRVLEKLADDQANREIALRTFEIELLRDLGYGLPETGEAWYWDGQELKPWSEEIPETERHIVIDPLMIKKLNAFDFRERETLAFAKRLMRRMIAHYAGDKPLNTRRIVTEMNRF